jgi:hypothetical protein
MVDCQIIQYECQPQKTTTHNVKCKFVIRIIICYCEAQMLVDIILSDHFHLHEIEIIVHKSLY